VALEEPEALALDEPVPVLEAEPVPEGVVEGVGELEGEGHAAASAKPVEGSAVSTPPPSSQWNLNTLSPVRPNGGTGVSASATGAVAATQHAGMLHEPSPPRESTSSRLLAGDSAQPETPRTVVRAATHVAPSAV